MKNSSSRTAKFVRSILSGYGLIGLNIAYSLLSVPIVLHYLSRAEFGLWALISQMLGYIGMIDLGMNSSVMRTLVDHKDDRDGGVYGGVILVSFYVTAIQGIFVTIAGIGCSFFAGSLLNVDPALQATFTRLMVFQSLLVGVGFTFRPLSALLDSHQRYDVVNAAFGSQQISNLVVLWVCLHAGCGIFSLVWASVASALAYWCVAFSNCMHLHLFPKRGCWGRPTWPLFRDLFSFGMDMFLYAVGGQLVNASQVILLTHIFGLDTAAIWSVCMRPFNMLMQFVFKISDYSSGALAEMIVRKERVRLLSRFRSIAIFSGSIAALAAVMLASCNQLFVTIWTSGRISWSGWNNLLLAIWLVLLVLLHLHAGFIGQTKKLEALRYLYLVEGVFFITGTLLFASHGGVSVMIGVSIVGTCLFTLRYSLWRTARYFQLPLREVFLGWSLPMLRLLLVLIPIALSVHWLASDLPTRWRLIVTAASIGIPGVILLFRLGLDDELKSELLRRIPARAAPAMACLFG